MRKTWDNEEIPQSAIASSRKLPPCRKYWAVPGNSFYLNVFRDGLTMPFLGFGFTVHRSRIHGIGFFLIDGTLSMGIWYMINFRMIYMNRKGWKNRDSNENTGS
jgi:hypothetical protein